MAQIKTFVTGRGRGQESVSYLSTELSLGPRRSEQRPSGAQGLFYYSLMMTGGRFPEGQILRVMFGLDFKWSVETERERERELSLLNKLTFV